MKEIKDQKYKKFHEKHKAPGRLVSIAEFVENNGKGDPYMMNMSRDRDISNYFIELVEFPMKSKETLDSILLHYLEMVNVHEAAPIDPDEIRFFEDLSNLFYACFKFQEGIKNQEGGRDE
jgi:hypothetical protein